MLSRSGSAHVVSTTRTYEGKVYRTHLLRRSFREDGKVKNETLGNLSHLPEPLIEIIRRSLQGERFVPVGEAFEITSSLPRGHVQAVRLAMKRLDIASLLGGKASRSRDLVLAMIAARIVSPLSKLSTSRVWHTTTLAPDFGVEEADEEDLYAAMDWLLSRQDSIQKKLSVRHLKTGGRVLYDLSSSYFEGTLSCVERVFRLLKTTNLKVRPIYHRAPDRVRAHLLLCLLACYVEWRLREAWRELMFADADLSAQATRDPVALARRSPAAMDKIRRRRLDDGTPVQSFSTLMAELSTLVRNTCRVSGAAADAPPFEILTTPTPAQRRALDLIEQIRM